MSKSFVQMKHLLRRKFLELKFLDNVLVNKIQANL